MKNFKKIITAVMATAISISSLAIPASAATASLGGSSETLLFTQDFSTADSAVQDPDPMSEPPVVARHFGSVLWEGDFGHSDSSDTCLVISKDLSGSAAAQISVGDIKTTGTYKLTYKLYPSSSSNILIIDSEQTGGARARNNTNNPNCLWFSMPSGLASDRKWYDVEFVINLDTDDATITVRPEGSDTVVHTDSKKYYAGLGIFEFAQDIPSAGSAYAARIDDIAFYSIAGSVPNEPDYIFAQDFAAADSAVQDPSPLPAPPVAAKHFGSQLWAGDFGHADKDDQCLVISKDLSGSAAAQISVGNIRSAGTYKLTYKLYPSSSSNILIIDSEQTGGARARNNTDNPNCLWFSMPSSLASDRKWYDVEFVINLDTDDATITVRPEGSDTVVHTDSKKYYANLGVFEFAQDIPSAGSANAARIDDIVFYNVYDSEPEFTEANIKLYAGDAMQADFNKISKFTDKIVISFPQKIKAETLLASNIYLTDENGATIATSGQVVDGMECTLTLSEPLTADSIYTLHIKNLKNVSGYVMSGEFTQDFVVESAVVVSGLKNIMIGTEEVVSLSQLTAGNEVTVNYSVENTTDTKQDATIIIAFYNYENDVPVLVSCNVIPGEIAANTKADNLSQTFTVPSDTFNSVTVMLWDDVDGMKPLTSTIEINN